MSNLEKYIKVFIDTFGVSEEEAVALRYQDIKAWDSIGHMDMIATLEEEFDIMMDSNDIIDFNSFDRGKEILKNNYGVCF